MGSVTRYLRFVLPAILLVVGTGSARSQQPADSGASAATAVVEGYLAAYNRHDASGLRRWLADTFVLGGVPAGPSDERLIPDTLVRRLQGVFEHSPDLRAHLLGRLTQGGDVVDRYRITFGKRTVFELFIYRVKAGRITGMWEFHADSARGSPQHATSSAGGL
jgi:hypothetical protein